MNPGSDHLPEVRSVPGDRVVRGRLRPPSSKSLTQRALNMAVLTGRALCVHRPLIAVDTQLYLSAMRSLGWSVVHGVRQLELTPGPKPEQASIWCGDNGTMLRFLTATLATIPGSWTLDGSARLRQRPLGPLVEALRDLGARIQCQGREGFAPLLITGGRLRGGEAEVDSSLSSQFASALLMAGTRAVDSVSLLLRSPVSGPYLDLTVQMLEIFGAPIEADPSGERFRVHPNSGCGGVHELEIEADDSAAAYPAAAAFLTGGQVVLEGLSIDSRQGDRGFLKVLEEMGARVEWSGRDLVVSAGDRRVGVEVDLSKMPDQVPTLAALAPFAEGKTVVHNVAHLRHKESDRLAAMVEELQRLGAHVDERTDGIEVEGSWHRRRPPSDEVRVKSHGDHRIAMSLAVCGLRRPGVRIQSPDVVAKSYPEFWHDFEGLLRR